MMNNKETEKLIEQTLNSEKPDKNVLSMAKNIMSEKKQRPIKKAWQFYAAAASSAILIIFGVIAAALSGLNQNNRTQAQGEVQQAQPNVNHWLIISIVLIIIGIIVGIVTAIIKFKKK